MVGWYDFSDTSTLTFVNGLISSITNKSGTAPTLSQSTEANRPSLAFLGGRQAGLFDGSNDVLFSNTNTQGYGTLFAAVGNPGVVGPRAAASFAISGAAVESFCVGVGSLGEIVGAGRWSAAGGTTLTSGVAASGYTPSKPLGNGGGFIISFSWNRVSSAIARVNGRTEPLGGQQIQGNQPHAAIGATNFNASYIRYWPSLVGEVLHYATVLQSRDIERVSRYLSVKWGISG